MIAEMATVRLVTTSTLELKTGKIALLTCLSRINKDR